MTSREMEISDEACRLCRIHAVAGRSSLPADHKCAEHMHFHAAAMSSSAATAYKASLELLFAHVADIHTLMLKIIATKYGHSVEEMLATVMEDEEWNSLYLHPTLKALTYFEVPEKPTKMTIRKKKK
jgi:hypothetical protein